MVKFTASMDVNSMIEYNGRVGIQLPKIGKKGMDAKNSLKWVVYMSKRGKDHKRLGVCLKCKKLFKRKFIN